MSRVTSKLQVTVPKAIADEFGIRPGSEIEWVGAGDAIRVLPATRQVEKVDLRRRLDLFDQATARQQRRQATRRASKRHGAGRGWSREELYERGVTR